MFAAIAAACLFGAILYVPDETVPVLQFGATVLALEQAQVVLEVIVTRAVVRELTLANTTYKLPRPFDDAKGTIALRKRSATIQGIQVLLTENGLSGLRFRPCNEQVT